MFGDKTLELSEEPLASGPVRAAAPTAPAAAGGFFIPRTAASRPRAGLGSKKARTVVAHTAAATTESSSAGATGAGRASASTAKGQDDFRKMLSGGS